MGFSAKEKTELILIGQNQSGWKEQGLGDLKELKQFPWMVALKGNPLDWLLERDNPPVRFLTFTQILDKPLEDPEVMEAKKAMWEYPPARDILGSLQDAPLDLDTLFRFGIPGD